MVCLRLGNESVLEYMRAHRPVRACAHDVRVQAKLICSNYAPMSRCSGITRKGTRCTVTSASEMIDNSGRLVALPLRRGGEFTIYKGWGNVAERRLRECRCND